jgi:hypothetical protein
MPLQETFWAARAHCCTYTRIETQEGTVLKKYGFDPDKLVTDDLRSNSADLEFDRGARPDTQGITFRKAGVT